MFAGTFSLLLFLNVLFSNGQQLDITTTCYPEVVTERQTVERTTSNLYYEMYVWGVRDELGDLHRIEYVTPDYSTSYRVELREDPKLGEPVCFTEFEVSVQASQDQLKTIMVTGAPVIMIDSDSD